MIQLVSCELSGIGNYAVADAKDSRVRFDLPEAAEMDRGEQLSFVVFFDGMGSISMGLTILRLLVEMDTPRRLALLGVGPDTRPLVEAWNMESDRIPELIEQGRLVIQDEWTDSDVLDIISLWGGV